MNLAALLSVDGGWRPAAAAADDFDRRRLQDMVQISASLRPPMVLTAIVVAALPWVAGVPWGWPLAWALMAIAVREHQIYRLMHLSRAPMAPAERIRRVALNKLPLGLAHGSAALFMPWMPTEYDAIQTMILLSLCAGAVSTTFMVPRAFTSYAFPVAVPTAVGWLFGGHALDVGIGILILMYLLVQIHFARRNLQMYEQSYQMRLENTELLQALSEERERLAQARDAAVQADISKSRFLAAASHDLRQPLQSLTLNSAALVQMPIASSAHAVATDIAQGVDAMRQMLEGLLDISKLDAGAVTPVIGDVWLSRLLHGLHARFASPAAARGLTLRVECAPSHTVRTDPALLARIISNLLDNAIKFTERGDVWVEVQPQGEHVRLSVCDTGIGIDPDKRRLVFEDLEQIGNPQRDPRLGHGLGLGIVRRLAQMLAIRCEVQAIEGAGTRVVLWVPHSDAQATAASEAPALLPMLAARRVLIVEDDPTVCAAYQRVLELQGCSVHVASGLDEALQVQQREQPEVAIVDYRLPGEADGLQVLERLREADPGLAAIVASADQSASMLERASRQRAPVLRKPVTEFALVSAIHAALADVPAPRAVRAPAEPAAASAPTAHRPSGQRATLTS